MNAMEMIRGADVGPAKNGKSAIVERIIRQIDRMIGDGELQPGDPISEPTICAAMNVSRVPVREAIRILAGEGVLELAQHRSARVRSPSAQEIMEMMEVLNGFSVLAIHLICVGPPQPKLIEDLIEISARIKTMAKSKSTPTSEIWKEVRIYHLRLITGCGNEYLENMLRKTRMHYYSRHLIEILGPHALIEAAPTYVKITKAIAQGEQQKAMRILFAQVENSKTHARLL